jgi:hypothetical protein
MKGFAQWWKVNFLSLEFWLAILLGAAFYIWLRRLGGEAIAAEVLKGNRAGIYGTLASIFGSLLGFVIASVSIVIGFAGSEKLAILRSSKHYSDLWRVFTSATRALGITTIVALAGLVFDRDAHPKTFLLALCLTSLILSVFSIARCIWVLDNLNAVFSTAH